MKELHVNLLALLEVPQVFSHCCGPISSFDQSPFGVRRQQNHWLMFIILHCRRSVYVLTRFFSCCHSAILPAIFREPKYLAALLNIGTVSTPKEVFYILCIFFSVVLLGNSLTICSYIRYQIHRCWNGGNTPLCLDQHDYLENCQRNLNKRVQSLKVTS